MSHDIKVGDVFVESWGYDQTNIDFYQVTKVMPKSVMIGSIYAKTVGGGYDTKLLPDVGHFRSTDTKFHKRKLVQFLDRNRNRVGPQEVDMQPYLTMSSFSTAFLWNGKTAYHDTIAAGMPGH